MLLICCCYVTLTVSFSKSYAYDLNKQTITTLGFHHYDNFFVILLDMITHMITQSFDSHVL